MFIAFFSLKGSSLQRSEIYRSTYLYAHCAPLERQTLVGRQVYKHLAPLEPKHRLVAIAASTLERTRSLTES